MNKHTTILTPNGFIRARVVTPEPVSAQLDRIECKRHFPGRVVSVVSSGQSWRWMRG